jgi:hypothetical protein
MQANCADVDLDSGHGILYDIQGLRKRSGLRIDVSRLEASRAHRYAPTSPKTHHAGAESEKMAKISSNPFSATESESLMTSQAETPGAGGMPALVAGRSSALPTAFSRASNPSQRSSYPITQHAQGLAGYSVHLTDEIKGESKCS